MMTPQQEIDYIHTILNHLNNLDEHYAFGFDECTRLFNYTELEATLLQERMVAEKLVYIIPQRGQPDTAALTKLGARIANEPGGYKERQAALQRERNRQQALIDEQLELSRSSTNAAVRSADAADRSANASDSSAIWAKRGVWVSIISAIIAALALIVAWQANQSQDATELRIARLEQQLKLQEQVKKLAPVARLAPVVTTPLLTDSIRLPEGK